MSLGSRRVLVLQRGLGTSELFSLQIVRPQCKPGILSPMLGLPSCRDVVSSLTHYVNGSFERLYWGSMMRHVPELKQ
jgi:hypothetical protein